MLNKEMQRINSNINADDDDDAAVAVAPIEVSCKNNIDFERMYLMKLRENVMKKMLRRGGGMGKQRD